MKEKRKIFTGGEDITPEKLNVPYENFYTVMVKLFGFKKLKEWHSGDLNKYLLWIFGGLVALIVLLVVLWV